MTDPTIGTGGAPGERAAPQGFDGAFDGAEFEGAKAAVWVGDRLLVLIRDDRPDIPYPGQWDFPGGGRDNAETPEETLAREMEEEVGLDFDRAQVLWRRRFPAWQDPDRHMWFFVLCYPSTTVGDILFGDEGTGWALLTAETFLAQDDAVASLKARLTAWQDAGGCLPE